MRWIIRLLIAAIVFYGSFMYADINMGGGIWNIILPLVSGLCLIIIFLSEIKGYRLHPMAYAGGLLGAIMGLVVGGLFGYVFLRIPNGIYLFILLNAVFGYLGYSIGIPWGKEISELPTFQKKKPNEASRSRVLDTSVIIDGRLADVCNTGFIDGTLLVPQFILNELQHIADSTDNLKRARGRRGLDILNRLQKTPNIKIEISELDYPKIREVDSKLIALAKDLDADIITTDFNLNKVAQIKGANVLNINELANTLKPIVLPGETLIITVTKQGKEKGQGVAYLDDGTMVVVEQGENLLNTEIEATVTSILQTPAGRMIFATPKNGNS